MKCDRQLADLDAADLQDLKKRMSTKALSAVPFLKPGQSLQAIKTLDDNTLQQHKLTSRTLINKLDEILRTAEAKLEPHKQAAAVTKSNGLLQWRDEKALALVRTLRKIGIAPPDSSVDGAEREEGSWVGPNPFVHVPNKCSEWSVWSAAQITIMIDGRVYSVATITWGGAQECPFKHPDDKEYHGYEYGSSDHVVIAPGVVDGKPYDRVMSFSDLSLHMLREHGFFGGDNCYRIDPIELANLLGVGPDVTPQPCWASLRGRK